MQLYILTLYQYFKYYSSSPQKSTHTFYLLTSLFALWCFANAVTDTMVQAFKKVLELSNSQAAGNDN
jgi:fucose permease